jgi:serine/threonine-protein kinase
MVLSTGDVLSDRYRLDEPVADGGMGEVWRATDVSLGRTVAVKVLRPALLADPGFDARFRAEARMMAALTHPNVVDVYDYGHSPSGSGGEVAFLVMAYVDGEPLSRRIADAGRLSPAETMSVVAQAAEALHAAHQRGIIHRDVKPANLLIQPSGMVTLVDFGVARSPTVTQVTAANSILGTAMYMAPEQASGREVSPATDIYALGAVAYHCLAGHPPFEGDGPLEIALRHVSEEPPPLPGDIPLAARTLVERSMAKDPADRYDSAAQLAAAARSVMAGRGAVAAAVRAATARAATARAFTSRPGSARPASARPLAADPAAANASPAAPAAPKPAVTVPMARAASDTAHPAAAKRPASVVAWTFPQEREERTAPDLPLPPSPAEPDSGYTPGSESKADSAWKRAPRRGPRLAVFAGAAAVVLIGLVALATLFGPAKQAGRTPVEGRNPGAPAGSAPAPTAGTDGTAGVSATGPAVPVRASGPAAVPPPAVPPGGQNTVPAGQNTGPAPAPTTAGPVPTPTAAPTQPPATPTAEPSPTSTGGGSPGGGSPGTP